MKKITSRFFGLILLAAPLSLLATDPYKRNEVIDVIHYSFLLEVNDSTDVIEGLAKTEVLFLKASPFFELDFVDRGIQKDGMEVSYVASRGKKLRFTHEHDKLKIYTEGLPGAHTRQTFEISYHGIPRDGFTITKTKFGDRGFFGDNWPDLGRNWLPVVDHPSDKASVDFSVIAPAHYSVVANGIKIEESPLDTKRKLTRWSEDTDLPVKVMVVGIARFAVGYAGNVGNIRVESWVYPKNRDEGFRDYAVAVPILDFFNSHIGPYSYKKLASVQSSTRWGALENANTIFYPENSVTGKGHLEELMAHEEAHQWFGNSVTEDDWHHVWLSEGFATYFSNLYVEYAFGRDRFVEKEKSDRASVIAFYKRNAQPVVDTTILGIPSVLNTNTYQKAAWVLHMLRHRTGESLFWEGIQRYYRRYQNQNALTADFQHIMEEVSGLDLKTFFDQWIWRPGHPKIEAGWSYDARTKSVTVTVNQTQKEAFFEAPLEIGFVSPGGKVEIHTFALTGIHDRFIVPIAEKPQELILDPQTWLLYEGTIHQK